MPLLSSGNIFFFSSALSRREIQFKITTLAAFSEKSSAFTEKREKQFNYKVSKLQHLLLACVRKPKRVNAIFTSVKLHLSKS